MHTPPTRIPPGSVAHCPRVAILPPAPATRVLAALLVVGFTALQAPAQNVISSYSGPPPPQYPLPVERMDSGPALGPGGRPMSSDNIYPPAYSNQIVRAPYGPFFLPALLPVLGGTGPVRSRPYTDGYPREMAGEPYFMAYGNLAANHQLSAPRAERIARHRTARLALLAELRGQLSHGPDASTLASLAAAQTPRLLELESEAEQIRHDLTRVELFSTPADDIGKLAPSNEDPKFKQPLADVRMLLSAAHFRDGFSSDQRRLLEEMALETQLVIEPEPATPGPAPVFFWPAGARILSPAGLPPEAAARFAEFQRRKAALKDELHAALDRDRKQFFNLDNTETFARLAARQAPRFAELDALADQLRPALAADSPAAAYVSEHAHRRPSYYTAAVLTPGLSPAQRRLLLAAAAGDSLQ